MMMAEATRHPCPRDRVDIMAAIERAGLPIFDVIVRFQEDFGGVEYRVPGTEIGFQMGIMTGPTSVVDGFEEDGRYYFSCGGGPLLQFGFWLDQDGILYAYPNVLYPIASSAEKRVEVDAVLYEMYRHARSPLLPVGWRMVVEGVFDRDDRRPDARVPFPVIPEASDRYTTWWGSASIRVERTVYLDWDTGERDVVRAFAQSWKGIYEIRRMFSGIAFTYPDPYEGVPIVDADLKESRIEE